MNAPALALAPRANVPSVYYSVPPQIVYSHYVMYCHAVGYDQPPDFESWQMLRDKYYFWGSTDGRQ